MNRLVMSLVAIALVGGVLRLWELDLAQVQDIDDVRDWQRAGALLDGKAPWWLGPDAAISTGKGARLPGGFYYVFLSVAHRFSASPLSGLALIALGGTAAATLTFFAARTLLPLGPAVVAGFLAATSPVWVLGSRRIWNPNLLPLFSVVFFWAVAQCFIRRSRTGLLLTFFVLGLLLQLHLSSLALLPIAAIAVLRYVRQPRLLAGAVLLLVLPLLPFVISDANNGWHHTGRLVDALTSVMIGREPSEGQTLPFPICWPLPYLPPLGSCGYMDDTIDRTAAALLSSDSATLHGNDMLELYSKTGLGRLVRSTSLTDLPAKIRAHNGLPTGMRIRYWLDTGASLALFFAVISGFAIVVADARKDRRARILLLFSLPVLFATLLRGVGGAHHFYFIFFPVPALLVARSTATVGRFGRIAGMALVLVMIANVGLLIDRRMAVERLGGTPSYGVAHRYRLQAADWLSTHGVQRIGELSIVGGKDAWRALFKRGGQSPRYRVLEIAGVDLICRSGPTTCGEEWLTKRARWREKLVYTVPGIWIYRMKSEARESTGEQ